MLMLIYNTVTTEAVSVWPRGQAVKTSPFHGGNTGSIPVGVICRFRIRNFQPGSDILKSTAKEAVIYSKAQ